MLRMISLLRIASTADDTFNGRRVKVLYIGPPYFKQFFFNGRNIHVVQWHGYRLTHQRPQIAAVKLPGTAAGFLSTGTHF